MLVRIGAAGVNPVDAKTPRGEGVDLSTFPFTVDWDLAGTVVAAGPEVAFRPGDRVFGMAAFPGRSAPTRSRQSPRPPISYGHPTRSTTPTRPRCRSPHSPPGSCWSTSPSSRRVSGS
ncbi:alcohol dehydrogenase catalytic domain-containing protein [Cryptosporangium phraense]|uniref:Alcohol dehydrogenase-like N-terminal domain-containing protein n=1 Tax=Cryptosporangium phraense TaxID=2593070 RepID=A0A545AME2_9ACTN|nr:hypothetical protein FL583_24565 [Cryptosporangium phraense]